MLGPGLPLAPPFGPPPDVPEPGVLTIGPEPAAADGLGGAGVRIVGAMGLGGKEGAALATFLGLGILGAGAGVGRGVGVGAACG
jgi:hypothetical protein